MGNVVLRWLGKRTAAYLTEEIPGYEPSTPPDYTSLERSIQPGDVLLIEGNTRISSIIKYLTQLTWSHSAMFVGAIDGFATADGEAHVLIEATPVEGVVTAPLSKYRLSHVRICRAHALTPQDRSAVVRYVTDRIGSLYDSRNVFDLMRYLLPLPVPTPFRRRALALGPSGIDLCGPQIRSWVAFCFPDLPADSPAAH
jgi:hypothetical protein